MTEPTAVQAPVTPMSPPAEGGDHLDEGQLQKVGLRFAYGALYHNAPLLTVGSTLCLLSLNLMNLPIQVDPDVSQTAPMLPLIFGVATGGVDAFVLTLLGLESRKENRRRRLSAKKAGRKLLPKNGLMSYLKRQFAGPTEALSIDSPSLTLPALGHLRTTRAGSIDMPANLRRFFQALDRWRTITGAVAPSRRARTIIALENLDRCLAEFTVAPNHDRDDGFLLDLQQTVTALTDRMERDIEDLSDTRARERSAEMRAIARSLNMDR